MPRPCPCGNKLTYETCCGPCHSGATPPETPVQLMRSRYSAYAEGRIDYLIATSAGPAAEGLDPAHLRDYCQGLRAVRLDIIETTGGGPADSEGEVEFKAHLRKSGRNFTLHERSRFERADDWSWRYVDGLLLG